MCGTTSGMIYTNLTRLLQEFGSDQDRLGCAAPTLSAIGASVVGFCRGSASVPRGFVTSELGTTSMQEQNCDGVAAVEYDRSFPFQLGQQCSSATQPHL